MPHRAATGIAGEGARNFLETYAFPVHDCGAGVTSVINALLRTDYEFGDALNNRKSFVANSRILELLGLDRWLVSQVMTYKLKLRDFTADILAIILLIGQRYTYSKFLIQKTSPESFDEDMKKEFYKWSQAEVQPWL